MKILYLTNHLNVGGISSYLFTLAKGMQERAHQVYLASGPGELVGKFSESGIKHILVPLSTKAELSPKVLISFFKLLPLIKKENIQVIHANTRVTQVLACLLSRYTGRAFISTCHGFFKPKLSRSLFPCWGDKVIAISAQVQEHLIKDFHLEEENIRLINNGVDVERFVLRGSNDKDQMMRSRFGLKEGPIVGIIARLSEVKGHVYLIQAMKEVLRRFPDTQLLIVGQGKIKDDLIFLVKKLGIDDKVFFVPNIIDTAAALSIMDLFVLPSLHEGLGLSLMEAMAAGLPCIASNVGGIKSLIQDQVTGLLTAPKNPGELSKAVMTLLSDPDRARVYGYNARKFILDNFSKDGMLEKTEKVYKECLKTKG